MNPTNSPQSPAGELWNRFAGLFGGDAIERKFGAKPPVEWEVMVGRLKPFELERGMRRLVYSGKSYVPSLPEFVKLCRTVGGTDDVDDGPKPPALPAPEQFTGDDWDAIASQHLLAYTMRVLREQPRKYGRSASYLVMRSMGPKDIKANPNADASPEWIRARDILVAFKSAWARDMREGNLNPETGEIVAPSLEEQKAAWEDCMQRAEAEIARKAAA